MSYAAYGVAAMAAIGATGSYEQGESAANASRYKAQVALNNQIIAGRNSDMELTKGTILADSASMKSAANLGFARNEGAASGIDVNASGTATRVQSDIVSAGKVDALTIRNNAARSAYNWQVKGMSEGATAQLDQMAAEQDIRAGVIGMMPSLGSGASKIGMSFDSGGSNSNN